MFANEDDELPERINSSALNEWIFNEDTIRQVLNTLMTQGIKIEYGSKMGKSIIFAKNHRHAEKIKEIFDKEYPSYNGYCQVIVDSPTVANLQRQVDAELGKDHPSEEYIVEKISDIASQLYKETQAKKIIVAQIARKRASMMRPQENFNCDYFSDLIDYITLSSSGKVRLHTKVGTEITEGENE